MTPSKTLTPVRAVALAAALALSACSQMPRYERPASPVPDQWPTAQGRTTQPPAADLAWPDFFTDATLRELIHTALAHNRDLRAAVLTIEQARAQRGLRSADSWPTLNATATGSRTPTASGGIASTYTGGLLVTAYELDFFGRVASLQGQALAQYLATQEASQTVRISLIASVAQSWLALLADEELLQITRQSVASREDTLRLVRLRHEHGAASELDLHAVESTAAAARVALAQLQRQRALNENTLTLLLGQPLPAALRESLASARLAQVRLPQLPAGLPSDLLTQRPDIRQAEQLLIAAHANIGAARAAFFPRITLTAGVGSASSELSGLFRNGAWGFTLAPQLLAPIWDAGRNQATLDAAQASRDVALAQYDKAIQNAFREVSDALAARHTLTWQLQAQRAQHDADTARLRLSTLRVERGASSRLDWLDAQRAGLSSQQAVVQTQLAQLQNQVALFKALGAGQAPRAAPDRP